MTPTDTRPLCRTTRSLVVVTEPKETWLNVSSAIGYAPGLGTSTKAEPFQYCTVHEAGSRTPPPSSRKYTSLPLVVTGWVQSSSIHCWPVCGQQPHRMSWLSLEDVGKMPSLIAVTCSHGEV